MPTFRCTRIAQKALNFTSFPLKINAEYKNTLTKKQLETLTNTVDNKEQGEEEQPNRTTNFFDGRSLLAGQEFKFARFLLH